jgi:hypothetical protein
MSKFDYTTGEESFVQGIRNSGGFSFNSVDAYFFFGQEILASCSDMEYYGDTS